MRWVILALAGVVALSLALTSLHPSSRTVGQELREAMEWGKTGGVAEKGGGELRGAVAIVEYFPEESQVAAIRGEKMQRGVELVPGISFLSDEVNSHWTAWEDARFTWRLGEGKDAAVEPLRAAYAEDSAGWVRVRHALGKMGLSPELVGKVMQSAGAHLAGLGDANLMQSWLRADRAALVQEDELAKAAEEALLLAARPERGPVLTFRWGGEDIFVLQVESGGAMQWMELKAYGMDRKLAWRGMLRVEGKGGEMPDASRVRRLMVVAAEEAGK